MQQAAITAKPVLNFESIIEYVPLIFLCSYFTTARNGRRTIYFSENILPFTAAQINVKNYYIFGKTMTNILTRRKAER